MPYKYLKGPVISRRLGRSLGINLLGKNICTFNCVYCETGKTEKLTTERRAYVPADDIISELADFLADKPELDYITFSGSGEPTLNSEIKTVIEFLNKNFGDYRIALLTNASLFYKEKVLEDVLGVDLIVPSLDAASAQVFEKINRPDKDIELKEVIEGLEKLRRKFAGEIWLEIFIIHGLNDTPREINNFKKIIERIAPDRVQLNSLDRPPVEDWVGPVKGKTLVKIAGELGENVEVVRPLS